MNPPTPPPAKTWATYVSSRRPQKKLHTNGGHAKNAIAHSIEKNSWCSIVPSEDMIIWQQVDDEWVVYAHISKDMKVEDLPWRNK